MSTIKTIGVVLLAVLMTTTVVGASAVVAVDRTILDADKVSTTFENEGIQEEMTARAREQVETEVNNSLQGEELPPGISIDANSETVARQAITESYVNGQLTRNIEAIIAFLEGDTENLTLQMNTEPVKQSLIDQFDEEAVTVDTVTLTQQRDLSTADGSIEITDTMVRRLNEDQAGYTSVRRDLRAQQVTDLPIRIRQDESVAVNTVELATAIDLQSAQGDIDVSDRMIEDLNRDAAGYSSTRSDIRQQIQSASSRELSSTEIDQRLRLINEQAKADAAEQARAEYGDQVSEESLQNIIALQNTVIDGLTDPDLDSFEAYADRRDSDKRALEESLTADLNQRLREISADVQADAAAQAETQYSDQVGNETLQAIVDLQSTVIRGFIDPDLTEYSAYESQRDANETALESAIASEIQQRIDGQVDDQISLGNDLDENTGQLETVQSGLGLIGTLVFVLPLLFLGLAALVYAVTRSIRRTVSTAGYSLLVGGGIGAVLGFVLVGRVVGALESSGGGGSAAEEAFIDAFAALARTLFNAHITQSAVLAVLGVILIVGVYVESRRGSSPVRE
ncbi:hypothetical protein GRX03_14965 [Halovenus sp. WSH3]|uniref:Uncharacterized protein n=1 Tax=Halovenus carboxidivorans TaxID=2692199 RepID=A0A6B0TI64_9EURY|nr:hypothetical protein [Halovenus carboxidivorans]MXR52899.1 hypothetical protein [Halovenus carboxidivorans]